MLKPVPHPETTIRDLRKKLRIAKRLASAMSTWSYSQGKPPAALNQMFIDWVDSGKLPASIAAIDAAEKE